MSMKVLTGNEPAMPIDYDLDGFKESRECGLTILQHFAIQLMAAYRIAFSNGLESQLAESAVSDAKALIDELNK